MEKKFQLGEVVITPNALNTVNEADVAASLIRHASGDWGECCAEDSETNNEALKNGARIFSVYLDRDGVKFWIITEHDRSITTILRPQDY